MSITTKMLKIALIMYDVYRSYRFNFMLPSNAMLKSIIMKISITELMLSSGLVSWCPMLPRLPQVFRRPELKPTEGLSKGKTCKV